VVNFTDHAADEALARALRQVRGFQVILAAMLEELTPEQYERVRAALRQHDASLPAV
jgi:hypothetical protein